MRRMNITIKELALVLFVGIEATCLASEVANDPHIQQQAMGKPQVQETPSANKAQSMELRLWELYVDGEKLDYSAVGKRFKGQGKDFGFVIESFTTPINGVGKFDAKIILSRLPVDGEAIPDVHCALTLTPQKAEFEKKFTYDPKCGELIVPFVKNLRTKTYMEHERFNAETNITGIGVIRFLFSRPRNIRYGLTKNGSFTEFMHDSDMQKTVYKVYYGFEGDPVTNSHELCAIDHDEEKTPCSLMWYVDASGRLAQVAKVVYKYPPKDLEDWQNKNKLSNQITYSRYVSDSESGQVIDPPENVVNCIKWMDAKEKYFRGRFSASNTVDLIGDAADYTYVDFKGALRSVQIWKYWGIYQQETTSGHSKELQDVVVKDDDLVTPNLAVLKPTDRVFMLPNYTSFVQNGAFKPGYYKRIDQQFKDNLIVERWQDCATQEVLTVTIGDIRGKGGWLPLNGFPHIRPEEKNGKTVFDLSQDFHKFTDQNLASLKNYLLTLYWVERRIPVLKYHYKDKKSDNTAEVGGKVEDKINELIHRLNCFDLDLDAGMFLVKEPTGKWFARWLSAFQNRNRFDPSSWKVGLYYKNVANLIKQSPEVQYLDIRGVDSNEFLKWCSDGLAKVTVLRVTGVDRKCLRENNLSDAQIMGIVSKSCGLQNLNLVDFPKAELKVHALLGTLGNNVDSLAVLDVSGVDGLNAEGDKFVSAVSMMSHLRVLNVLKTNLSNEQIIELAINLGKTTSLEELGIDMPFVWSVATELISSGYLNQYRRANTWYKKVELVRHIFVAPVTIPFMAAAGVLIQSTAPLVNKELVGSRLLSYGCDFRDAFCILAKIPNLNSLKLKIFDWIQNQQLLIESMTHLRTLLGLKSLKLEFVD